MNFGLLQILTLIGSVCLFLYGMKLMSEGLQKAAGDKLRNILAMMTNNRLVGALTGIFITALVQSSSATTVMIVSFVNAGLISLGQSMAVIMGANVGTTITGWIIALFGFKVNISSMAIPLIGFGVPLLFCKNNVYKSWGEFLIGFALLFLGLDYLSNSVPDLQSNPEIFAILQNYTNLGYWSVLIFAAIGLVLTIIIQSSSATFAVVLIMCSKGWLPFDIAAAMVLGSNIGTCITPLIASISGNIWAKRAAAGHLLFNLLGTLWTLVLYYPFIKLIVWISTMLAGDPNALANYIDTTDPTLVNQLNDHTLDLSDPNNVALAEKFADMQYHVSFGLSMFHTIFNTINICIMLWFTKLYVRIVTKLIPNHENEDERDESHLTFITSGMLSTAELSILQAHKELVIYGERTHKMFTQVQDLLVENEVNEFSQRYSRIEKYEGISDRMEVEIANYLTAVGTGRLSPESKRQVQMKMRMASEIESIGDSCYNIARILRRQREQSVKLPEELVKQIQVMFELTDRAMVGMIGNLKDETLQPAEIHKTQNLENEINNLRNQLKMQNVKDVSDGKYPYVASTFYMDIIVECEKIGDYIVNVVEAEADTKLSQN